METLTRAEAQERITADLINTAEYDRDFVISMIRNGWQSLDELSNREIESIYFEQFNEEIKIKG